MKRCPFCAEEIQDDAIFCRYCRNHLPTGEQKGTPVGKNENITSPPTMGSGRVEFKKELPKELNKFLYFLIGLGCLIGWVAIMLAIDYFLYEGSTYDYWELSSTIVALESIIGIVLIWLFATRGRYGEFSISRLLIMLFWTLIPIINWFVIYYMGKGVYMAITKQSYRNFILHRV